jgi:ribosomal 50S subunit-recycling heat shock protein
VTCVRLDLFLKWSRIIPRRTLARATCDAGRVSVNGQIARASRGVAVDDLIRVMLPNRRIGVRVRRIPDHSPSKAGSAEMIEILENQTAEHEPTETGA